jgi:hypothetical protein
MTRPIDADALKDDILKSAVMIDDRGIQTGYEIAIELIKRQPTIDAIPVSFIEEQAKLCNEIGFRRGEECYMALIEKWREQNDTETN